MKYLKIKIYFYSKDIFTYKVIKQTPGEIFNDLDLLTKLLTQPKAQKPAVLIEELPSSGKDFLFLRFLN